MAIDIGTFTHARISYSSATYQWLTADAGPYGWVNPEQAREGGSGKDERWHWEFFGVA
jgi:LAS superfamily LD-carboxypeptidase LdcB